MLVACPMIGRVQALLSARRFGLGFAWLVQGDLPATSLPIVAGPFPLPFWVCGPGALPMNSFIGIAPRGLVAFGPLRAPVVAAAPL